MVFQEEVSGGGLGLGFGAGVNPSALLIGTGTEWFERN